MKKNRLVRFAAILIAAMMVLSMAGVVNAAAKPKLKIAMVTDTAGLGDKSFNDSAYEGLKKVKDKLGADIKVLQSKKMEDYETNLAQLAKDKYDMVWAVGFLMVDALQKVATQYPNTKFGIIDSEVKSPNVLSVCFKEEEGSFLQGVVAGLATKSNTVGFVGGMEFPLIIKFEAGFIAGVKAVNPKAKVLTAYTGSFGDPVKGKELALAQFGQGADVIYHASGGCGLGVFEAAIEKNFLAIGVDMDQSKSAPKHIVSSMVKGVGEGLFLGTRKFADGKFKSELMTLGLEEEGVYTAFNNDVNAKLLKSNLATIKKSVEDYSGRIIKGKQKVASTREELK